MIVSKEFKKALRKMESLIVRLDGEFCTVELTKGHTDQTRVTFESKQRILNDRSFFFIMYCQDDILPMLHGLLKLNDEIVFRSRVNNSPLLDENKLFNDELCISVYRKDKLIVRDLVIDHSICYNNSARAIR